MNGFAAALGEVQNAASDDQAIPGDLHEAKRLHL
jgi:hypothetical protein